VAVPCSEKPQEGGTTKSRGHRQREGHVTRGGGAQRERRTPNGAKNERQHLLETSLCGHWGEARLLAFAGKGMQVVGCHFRRRGAPTKSTRALAGLCRTPTPAVGEWTRHCGTSQKGRSVQAVLPGVPEKAKMALGRKA